MKKTILITGSTDGIGKLLAEKLANEGHTLLVHGRKREKLEGLTKELNSINKDATVKGFVADFSSLADVKAMANKVRSETKELDVLINNAGVFHTSEETNEEGLEMRMVVNFLAPVLLTNELLPLLQKTNQPRVINLSSAAQSGVALDLLKGNLQTTTQEAYAQSKLALTMWSKHLALEHSWLMVLAVNPGSLLNTKMVREAYGNYWSPADKGMKILHKLTLKESLVQSGAYFDNDQGDFSQPHPDVYDKSKIDALMFAAHRILADI